MILWQHSIPCSNHLISYIALKNDHEQTYFTASQVWARCNWVLCSESQNAEIKVLVFLSWHSQFLSRLMELCQNYVLGDDGLRSLFPCWLSAKGNFSPYSLPPVLVMSIFKSSNKEYPLYRIPLLLQISFTRKKLVPFRDAPGYVRLTQNNIFLRASNLGR
jgi:hypothetical protein